MVLVIIIILAVILVIFFGKKSKKTISIKPPEYHQPKDNTWLKQMPKEVYKAPKKGDGLIRISVNTYFDTKLFGHMPDELQDLIDIAILKGENSVLVPERYILKTQENHRAFEEKMELKRKRNLKQKNK